MLLCSSIAVSFVCKIFNMHVYTFWQLMSQRCTFTAALGENAISYYWRMLLLENPQSSLIPNLQLIFNSSKANDGEGLEQSYLVSRHKTIIKETLKRVMYR